MYRDLEKQKAAWRCYYHRNKIRIRSKIKKHRRELKSWLREYKRGLSCIRCNEKDFRCLHFHHRNSKEKLFELSSSYASSIKAMKLEIAKCDVLCANCHAKQHYGEVSLIG